MAARPTTRMWRLAWLGGFTFFASWAAVSLFSYSDVTMLALVGAFTCIVVAFKHRWVTMVFGCLSAGCAFIGWIWATGAYPSDSFPWFVAAAFAAIGAVRAERWQRRSSADRSVA